MRPGRDWADGFVSGPQRVDKSRGNLYDRGVSTGLGQVPPKSAFIPRTDTYTEKFAIPLVLARFSGSLEGDETAGAGTTSVFATIYTPAAVLRLGISVFFEADDNNNSSPVFTLNHAPSWNIRALAKHPQTGRESPLQLAYPPPGFTLAHYPDETKPLPDSYETESAAQALRVTVNLDSTQFRQSYIPPTKGANVIIVATWEMADEAAAGFRRSQLFRQCSATCGEPPHLLNQSVL